MSIEALTLPALSAALDAAVLRQQVIAANIANVHSAGYAPKRVSFEAVLQASEGKPGLALRTRTHRVSDPWAAAEVQLDREVAALARNTAHYQALLHGLNRYLSVMGSAVSDGKR